MSLTTAQLAALKANIQGTSTLNSSVALQDWAAVANYYNTIASPTFTVWCSTVPTAQIFNSIIWANMTPVDAPDGTLTWETRSLCCQGKQFNLQTMLGGQQQLSTGLASIRSGLQDALTNLPSGASGALLSAGWVTLRDGPLKRSATNGEKVFATGGNGAFATPADLGFEGTIQPSDVQTAMGF